MIIETRIDQNRARANDNGPVLFQIRLQAPAAGCSNLWTGAMCVALDRFRLKDGLRYARTLLRHLPESAQVGFIAFSDFAEVIYSPAVIADRAEFMTLLESIPQAPEPGDALSAWLLAHRQLARLQISGSKQIVLVTNEVDQSFLQVAGIEIATSWIDPATTSMVGAVRRQLGGLRPTAIYNVSIRLSPTEFCEAIKPLGLSHSSVEGPWQEFCVGNLVVGEERNLSFNLLLPEFPCVDGRPVVSVENEAILNVEIIYDETVGDRVNTRRYVETIRVLPERSCRPTSLSLER